MDVLVKAFRGDLERIRDRLVAAGCSLLFEQALDPLVGLDFVRLAHAPTGLGIDLESSTTDYEDLVIERGRRIDRTQLIPSASPEDLLILKLIANRSKDQRDLIELEDGGPRLGLHPPVGRDVGGRR